MKVSHILFFSAPILWSFCAFAQAPQTQEDRPDFVRRGQELMREGKPEEALSLYKLILKSQPDSVPADNGAGILLDLMGRGEEARVYFQKAIDLARDPLSKANADRAMAMSWAFSGDCAKAVEYEQPVLAYYAGKKDFSQQGEIADEAARVCLDAGDLDTAFQWYFTGHDLGLKQPDIAADRRDLWEFRWEHAQARIAARRGNQTEAEKHVSAAKTVLARDTEMAKTQAAFLPYLLAYVALYSGNLETALSEWKKANQNDPFVQCMLAETYERSGQIDQAREHYRKAAAATSHNPASAYGVPRARQKLADGAEKDSAK